MNTSVFDTPQSAAGVELPFSLTIDGHCVAGAGSFSVVNPSTGTAFAEAPEASPEQLNEAVASARRAQPSWEALGFDARRARLHDLARLLRDEIDMFAALIVLEQGKPLVRARDEVERAARQMERLVALELPTVALPHEGPGTAEVHYRALGVIGAITPWNMPLVLSVPKIAHALYTGNTIVLKPSPYTPLAALRLGERAQHLFPPGVLNIVSGGNELGRLVAEHAGIDKVSFTGSVDTGKRVMASAAKTLKRVTLELGGNDAAIVLGDVDPQAVAPRLFAAAFANSGQICMAIKRLYVHSSIYAELTEALATLARNAKVGDGFEPDVMFGPVQNAAQYQIVLDLLDDARKSGAHFAAGGHALDRPGYFVAPTIVTGLTEGSRLVDEEPFGPVLPLLPFDDAEDAVHRANATRYGLSGSVWSNDQQAAAALATRLEVGTAWVNQHLALDAHVPFGGAKESGIGSEYGVQGLQQYMQAHVVNVLAAR